MKRIFFIFKGNNNSTYILNSASWKLLTDSLKFYKVRTFKSKFLKLGLKLLLFIKGKLWVSHLKNKTEIEDYIKSVVKSYVAFEINNNCSILISPTQDKIIINHYNQYFQKFAFGKSYKNVKLEAEIYKLFKGDRKAFQVSQLYDENSETDTYCSFKLSNAKLVTEKKNNSELDFIPVLVEFFKTIKGKQATVSNYLDVLLNKMMLLGISLEKPQIYIIEQLNKAFGATIFPLGLVHRDFKPWNVLNYDKPLIYDFEEAITDGPPLEDVFNYYIDPMIRYKNTDYVASFLFSKKMKIMYSTYLIQLGININFKSFLIIYLMERILFWFEAEAFDTSKKYVALLNVSLIRIENL